VATWKDPYSSWDPEGSIEEIPTNEWKSPESSWDAARVYKVPTHLVGRLRYYYKWPGHGGNLWSRLRYFPTRRTVLRFRPTRWVGTLYTRAASQLLSGDFHSLVGISSIDPSGSQLE
jgi:hypothetical protein